MHRRHTSIWLLGAARLLVCVRAQNNATTIGLGDYVAQGLAAATTNYTTDASGTTLDAANGNSSNAQGVPGLPTSYPFASASPIWTVAPTGSGASYASACNLEQLLYALLTTSQTFYGEQSLSTTYTTTRNFTATVTTLCDGHPRVVGSLTPTHTGTNSTIYTVPAITSAIPSPTCMVAAEEYTSYLEDPWSSAYNAPNFTMTVSLDSALTAMVTGSGAGPSSTVSLAEGPATTPPPIILNGTTFEANEDSTYYIQVWPESFLPLTPGGSVTVTQFVPAAYFMPQYNVSSQATATATEANITEAQTTATISATNTTTEDCPCTIAGVNVKLMYFEGQSSTSKDLCRTSLAAGTLCPYAPTPTVINAQNSVSIAIAGQVDQGSACPMAPNNLTRTTNSGPSIVQSGTTFYENRAYLAFDVLSATRQCGHAGGVQGQLSFDTQATTTFVGSQYTNGVIEVASTDLYSGCGYSYFYDPIGYSVNFADFQQPVPASAFLCQPACFEDVSYDPELIDFGDYINGKPANPGFCNVILEDEYKPQLLVPPQARDIDPAWSTCVLKLAGLYDPPVALTAQGSAAAPTVPAQYTVTTSSPSPGSTVTSPSAPQTSAEPDNLPTTSSEARPSTSPDVNGPSTPLQPPSNTPATYSVYASPALAASQSALDQPAGDTTAALPEQTTSDTDTASSAQTTDAGLSFTFAGSVYVADSADGSSLVAVPTSADPAQADPAAATTVAAFGNPTVSAEGSPAPVSPVAIGVGRQTVTASQDRSDSSVVHIGSTQVTAGSSAVVVNGQSVSLGPSGLVVGGANSDPSAVFQATQLAGGQSAVMIDGTTLSVGGAAATVSGTAVSLASNGVVVDGTQTLSINSAVASERPAAALTVGTQVITASEVSGSAGAIIVSGQTISPGGSEVTIDGTVVSAASNGLVVDRTRTVALTSAGSPSTSDDPSTMPTASRSVETGSSTTSTTSSASVGRCISAALIVASVMALFMFGI